jgi:GxxExxY protein
MSAFPNWNIEHIFTTGITEEHREVCYALRMATSARSHTFPVNQITGAIVNSAMKVHSTLGPGLLESAYQACLAHELRNRGFAVLTEVPLPVVYEGQKLEVGYRIDLVVANRVAVEVKSVEGIHPIHEAQLLSYMRLSGMRVGLLMNFNVLCLRDGIKRMVDGHDWQK